MLLKLYSDICFEEAAHESRLFPTRKDIYQEQVHIGCLDMDQEDLKLLQEGVEQISHEDPDTDQELREQQLKRDRIERESLHDDDKSPDQHGTGTNENDNTQIQTNKHDSDKKWNLCLHYSFSFLIT